MIATSIGLLVAYGAFAGTVLLFEQISKLEIQNELIGLEVTRQIRDQLFGDGGSEFSPTTIEKIGRSRCEVQWLPLEKLENEPNQSSVAEIEHLLANPKISARVKQSLSFLRRDSSSKIRLSALLVEEAAGNLQSGFNVALNNIRIENISLRGSYDVEIVDSEVGNFSCPSCAISVSDSIVDHLEADSATISKSWLRRPPQTNSAILAKNVLEFRASDASDKVIHKQNIFFAPDGRRSIKLLDKEGGETDITGGNCNLIDDICSEGARLGCSRSD